MSDQASEWPQLYIAYLKSEEWADRRNKVMRRAGHVCEGCRDQPAIDVHHLTYEHVTQEFLFELVALCRDCHERIHLQSDQPRPAAPTWTPRHKNPAPATVSNTPGARWRRARLAQLAAEHRAKTMAEPLHADRLEREVDALAPEDAPEDRYGDAA